MILVQATQARSSVRQVCSNLPSLGIGLLLLSLSMSPLSIRVARAVDEPVLQKLEYRHTGLVVDLGVGLWAWPIPLDADADGDYDLLVSCPDKPSNGVWFFENPTPHDASPAERAWPTFLPAKKWSPTVHYVTPSYVDGSLRVLSPGLEYPHFATRGTHDAIPLPVDASFYQLLGRHPKGQRIRHQQWRYVDHDRDGRIDLVAAIEDWSEYGWDDAYDRDGKWSAGPLHGRLFLFRNEGTTEHPRYASPTSLNLSDGSPIDTFGCPSPNWSDWDGDGDADLLCGEFLDGFTYFENLGSRTEPRYAIGQRLIADTGAPLRMELQMIVPVGFDWDRDGDEDLIVGDEDGRVAWIVNTGRLDAQRRPIFHEPRYFQQQADTLKCGALATPVGVDWDGDGDFDIVSGNTAGFIEWFENLSGPKHATPMWNAPQRLQVDGKTFRVQAGPNGSIQGPAEAKWGYTTLNVADWDHDGRQDILYNSILGEVAWLRNIGTEKAPQWTHAGPIEVDFNGSQPELAWGWRKPRGHALLTQWRTTPAVYDVNADGWLDLVMLDHEGYLATFERQRHGDAWRLQAPQRKILDPSGHPIRANAKLAGGSGRRKLCIVDWNQDGQWDLLLNSRNAELWEQTGADASGWSFAPRGSLASDNIEGHDVSPTVVDFDGDGRPEFLGGAEDGRFYYLKPASPVSK